jgi:hypothetical protein
LTLPQSAPSRQSLDKWRDLFVTKLYNLADFTRIPSLRLFAQIKEESSTAARLSKEAMAAFAARDLAKGKALMQQAVDALRNCQNLIEQYQQTCGEPSKG